MNENILKLIGNTPLVKINRLNPNKKVGLYVKLEGFNPGGSVKDRIALSMIEGAEKSGELTKDKIILEPTSGNIGIGIALVSAVKDYRVLLTMPKSVSVERRKILKALGAELLLTPKEKRTDGAIELAYKMAREEKKKYVLLDQFNNEYNWKSHYYGTGEEIWKQTNGKVTMFVAGMGTAGTLMGVSRRLKEYNPSVKIVGVEPVLGHKAKENKGIPWIINYGPYELKKYYLRAVFSDEGCVYIGKKYGYIALSRYKHIINLTGYQKKRLDEIERYMLIRKFPTGHVNKSITIKKALEIVGDDKKMAIILKSIPNLLLDESKILNSFGIDHRIWSRSLNKTHLGKYSLCCDLYINKMDSIIKFYKEIGFSLQSKQDKLRKIVK